MPKAIKIAPEDVKELVELLTNSVKITDETKSNTVTLIKDLYEQVIILRLELELQRKHQQLSDFEHILYKKMYLIKYDTMDLLTINTALEGVEKAIQWAKNDARDLKKPIPENINPEDYIDYFND